MRQRLIANSIIIVLSGFAVSVYLTGGVREQFRDRPWVGLLTVAVPYVVVYVGFEFFGKFVEVPKLAQLLGISVFGSFILAVYILTHTVIDLQLTSPNFSAAKFYLPTLSVFLMSSLIFFVFSSVFFLVGRFIITKLSE